MKLSVGLIALVLSFGAYAQAAHAQAAAKPLAGAKAKAHAPPVGCKLVGKVRGTKLWAGDCTNATAPAASEPPEPSEPEPPPDLKQ